MPTCIQEASAGRAARRGLSLVRQDGPVEVNAARDPAWLRGLGFGVVAVLAAFSCFGALTAADALVRWLGWR
jgi:hypothetical protein